MTNKGLRWGILGAGWIAGMQVSDMQRHGFTITAVGARDLAKAQAFAAEFGISTAYGSYQELAADPNVDAIYVATVHPAHAASARIALESGKHVLVEKPFTMDAAEARELVDLAASKNLVVLEAMWTRWLPHMVRIREILAEGLLGDVRTVLADHDQKNEHVERMHKPELGGGALLDLGIYPVSFAWDVFGAPDTVIAHATMTAAGVDRETAVILGYPSGAHAVLHTQMSGTGPNRAAIVGTDGRIEIDSVWYNQVAFTRYDRDGQVVERFDERAEGRGMNFQAAELERIVASGKLAGDILPPSETVAIMETLDEIRRQIGLTYPS
ncbi:Gfo/Idh/MocA family protein [Pseudolysinimonas yzui]|uniref:Oxidoreductase n=1 Tax=Pseudolysinimonas yzui TaxID=2708254 RepID=A0A8J3GTC4_9MICO|nr:Gfo/Idh/MocA family oxidoreductase [Pseudolysinimonas yzui]GHF26695.1 oxidoreductase [Pseudolysinimonas yzui]